MPSIIEVDTIKNKTGTQNTVLSTDGSGNVTIANSTFTGTTNGTIGSATFPTGHVIETKQTLYRGTVGVAYNDQYYQPSGFEVQTTAKVANVKFLINYAVSLGMGTANDYNFSSGIFKDSDSDPLSETTNSGLKTWQTKSSMHSFGYWDVSTSGQHLMLPVGGQYLYTSSLAKDASITFKIKVRQGDASNQVIIVNKSGSDGNDSWMSRSVSQITVQQIMP